MNGSAGEDPYLGVLPVAFEPAIESYDTSEWGLQSEGGVEFESGFDSKDAFTGGVHFGIHLIAPFRSRGLPLPS